MVSMKTFLNNHGGKIFIAATVGIIFIAVIRKRRKKRVRKSYPPNTIIHHQIGRGPYAPSITPFAVKLETYLRMTKVPFKNDHDSVTNRSSKGKLTWIEYNGQEVADSEFCIQFINETFNIDLDKNFSDEEIGAGRAIQRMVDEHLHWKTYPPNIVIHHNIGRGPYAPSLTPFAVKLETYLRMTKVPFMNENDSAINRSSKGKLTWIEYSGQEVADSEFCIRFINETFKIDPEKNFSEEQIGAGRAIQRMVDEHLYWTVALRRWVYDSKDGIAVNKHMKVPWLWYVIVSNMVKKQSYAQGVGRHSEEEVLQVMDEDLQALSKFLGKKKFMLGDHASQTDCAVFGMLSQVHWHSFGGAAEKLYKKYPNLSAFCERMKAEFWPDWDDCITHGGTRKASK